MSQKRQNDFFEFLLQRKLSFIRVYTQVIWRAFAIRPKISHLSNTFKIWVSQVLHFATFVFVFFVWWDSILWQIYWILNLQSLKLVYFMVANTWKRKYAEFWLLLIIWRCLLNRVLKVLSRRRVKTLWTLVVLYTTMNSKLFLINLPYSLSKFLLHCFASACVYL